MSVISKQDFQATYGPGRPPCKGSRGYTPEADIRVLTALADHFRVRRCLEIGCNVGATAAAMLAAAPDTAQPKGKSDDEPAEQPDDHPSE